MQHLKYGTAVNPTRTRHPKKDVEQGLRYAESSSWSVQPTSSGHRWGVVSCNRGCSVTIWSTPKNPANHAKDIRRAVDKCPHELLDDVSMRIKEGFLDD